MLIWGEAGGLDGRWVCAEEVLVRLFLDGIWGLELGRARMTRLPKW